MSACSAVSPDQDPARPSRAPEPATTRARKLLRSFRIATGIVVALLPAMEQSAASETNEPPQAITVVTARGGKMAETVRLTGTIVAGEIVSVKSDLDGLRVVAIEAEAGDTVQAGEVLARLDDTMFRVEEAASEARLARAEAAMEQARSRIEDAAITLAQSRADVERSGKLRERGFAAADALETRTTALKRAETGLAAARQALGLAEADRRIAEADVARIAALIESTRIRAPSASRLLLRNAVLGALATSGGDTLFTLAKNGIVELDAQISERDFARARVGQRVGIAIAGRPDRVYGSVRLLLPVLQATNRMGRLRVALPHGFDAPVGVFAQGEIEIGRREGVFLPASTMRTNGEEAYVHVLQADVVRRVEVEAGLRAAGLVEIVKGVEVGETVILKAGGFLNDGDRITPVDTAYAIPPSAADNALLTLASGQ